MEYYVSYYDYYQPEAYLPSSATYIEKDLAINDEIDKLRLAATSALLSGRKDVVVVSSVSCIYGMGNPADFYNNVIEVQQGKTYSRNVFLRRLVDSLYVRNDIDLNRGNFRVKGDTVDIYLAYADNLLRIVFWGDEVDSIEEVDPVSGVTIARFDAYKKASDEIHQIMLHYADAYEPISLDEAFLDISGMGEKYKTLGAIGRAIKKEIYDKVHLVASVGIAPNKFLAKMASDMDKPDGLFIIPYGKEKEILAPLPVRRLWGVGKVTAARRAGVALWQPRRRAPCACFRKGRPPHRVRAEDQVDRG